MGDVHTQHMTDLHAIILCGGRSSRFGTDKARALFGGEPLLQRIARLCVEVGVVPVAQADVIGKYDDLGILTRADDVSGLGPLGGILSALTTTPAEAVLVLTCDMPQVDADLLRGLIRAFKIFRQSIFYTVAGSVQPFPGIFTRVATALMASHLAQGKRHVKELVSALPHIHFLDDPDSTRFMNVNTQEDLCRCQE